MTQINAVDVEISVVLGRSVLPMSQLLRMGREEDDHAAEEKRAIVRFAQRYETTDSFAFVAPHELDLSGAVAAGHQL